MSFRRFVALGDSFTEGVGDPDPQRPNGVRGWADRTAVALAEQHPGLTYANLAIRGRKLRPILSEQVEPALALEPDLVSVYGGANDILRVSLDLDGLMADYDAAVARFSPTATVVMFTGFDPVGLPVFGRLRGRFAIFNELIREIADRHDATLIDFWRLRDFRDARLWDTDRMHLSSAGHQRMAIAVLDALGVPHDLEPLPLAVRPEPTMRDHAAWAREFAGPWIGRRLRRVSSGDALSPRWPDLVTPS